MRSTLLTAAALLLTSSLAIAQSVDDKGASPTYGNAGPTPGDMVDVRTPAGPVPIEAAVALTKQDHAFIDQATQGNLAEIAMAELAQDKDDLPQQLVGFADQLKMDHTAAQEELSGIAETYDLDLPEEPSERQKQKAATLEALSGQEFVDAFLQTQVEAHMQSIALYEPQAAQAEQAGGTNTPIEDYAAQILPKLQAHLELAQTLQAEMSPTASAQ